MKEDTQGMSVQIGATTITEKCFQQPADAHEEARRGA